MTTRSQISMYNQAQSNCEAKLPGSSVHWRLSLTFGVPSRISWCRTVTAVVRLNKKSPRGSNSWVVGQPQLDWCRPRVLSFPVYVVRIGTEGVPHHASSMCWVDVLDTTDHSDYLSIGIIICVTLEVVATITAGCIGASKTRARRAELFHGVHFVDCRLVVQVSHTSCNLGDTNCMRSLQCYKFARGEHR
eukprot:2194068-Amphidinium_carterae.1